MEVCGVFGHECWRGGAAQAPLPGIFDRKEDLQKSGKARHTNVGTIVGVGRGGYLLRFWSEEVLSSPTSSTPGSASSAVSTTNSAGGEPIPHPAVVPPAPTNVSDPYLSVPPWALRWHIGGNQTAKNRPRVGGGISLFGAIRREGGLRRLQIMGEASRALKKLGYRVSMAPAEFHLDVGSPNLSLQEDQNTYAWFLREYMYLDDATLEERTIVASTAFDADFVGPKQLPAPERSPVAKQAAPRPPPRRREKTFDFVSVQIYTTFGRASQNLCDFAKKCRTLQGCPRSLRERQIERVHTSDAEAVNKELWRAEVEAYGGGVSDSVGYMKAWRKRWNRPWLLPTEFQDVDGTKNAEEWENTLKERAQREKEAALKKAETPKKNASANATSKAESRGPESKTLRVGDGGEGPTQSFGERVGLPGEFVQLQEAEPLLLETPTSAGETRERAGFAELVGVFHHAVGPVVEKEPRRWKEASDEESCGENGSPQKGGVCSSKAVLMKSDGEGFGEPTASSPTQAWLQRFDSEEDKLRERTLARAASTSDVRVDVRVGSSSGAASEATEAPPEDDPFFDPDLLERDALAAKNAAAEKLDVFRASFSPARQLVVGLQSGMKDMDPRKCLQYFWATAEEVAQAFYNGEPDLAVRGAMFYNINMMCVRDKKVTLQQHGNLDNSYNAHSLGEGSLTALS